jgi:hypothetical protein
MLLAQQYNVMFNPGVSGPTATPTATPGGSSWAKTFDDDHNTDHSDWVGYGITCTENAGSSEDLSPGAAQGSCNFTGSSQPTDADQWGFMEFGDSVANAGPMLRSTSGNMTESEYMYAARVNGASLIEIRVCDGNDTYSDSNCTTMDTGIDPGANYAGDGDAILFAVANEEDDTVLCLWVFDSTVIGGLDICNDSADWGNAVYCINDDGTPPTSKLDDFIDCGDETDCNGWASDGPNDNKGWPGAGQVNVRTYSGSGSNADFSTHTCGGTL